MDDKSLWALPARFPKKRASSGPRKQPERSLQIRVATMLTWMLPPEVPWTAIGHGGGGERRGQILKRMGVKPGWMDIILVFRGRFIGIELKSGTYLSEPQKLVHTQIVAAGGVVRVCKSEEEVVEFLEVLGVPLNPVRLSPADRASGF